MKALFYTTQTVDCANHVRAWNSFSPSHHVAFDHHTLRNDWQLLEAAQKFKPDVIFYIGAHEAPGNPKPATFQAARKFAPLVNLCSDAVDRPWHGVLREYARRGCFDLQVAIDGAKGAPVDFSTLTPVDPRPFTVSVKRDIRCGFSGTVGRWNARSEIVLALSWFGGLSIRDRSKEDGGYEDHVNFLKRCRMLLNISYSGTGHAHHIKGRVLEAGWAGCALLESEGSPIGEWFPSDCYITYRHPKDAAQIIADLPDAEIDRMAQRLSEEVRRRFSPELIYGSILNKLNVDFTQSRPAA